MIFFNFVIKLD